MSDERIHVRATTQSMLVTATNAHRASDRHLSKLHVLKVIGRRSLPSLIEATLIPAALFYLCLVHFGQAAAMIAALAWSYGAVARRLVFGPNRISARDAA